MKSCIYVPTGNVCNVIDYSFANYLSIGYIYKLRRNGVFVLILKQSVIC
jgi:hypothetical protein